VLILRAATASVGIPLVLLITLTGGPAFWMVAAAVAGIAAYECVRLVAPESGRRWRIATALLAAVIVPSSVLGPGAQVAVLALATSISLCIALVLHPFRPAGSARDWAAGLASAVYGGLPLSLLVGLRQIGGMPLPVLGLLLDQGTRWTLLVVTTVWGVDAAGYLIGRLLGRRHLWPAVSPGKTWEGTIAGLIAGTSICLAWATGLGFPLVGGAAFGLVTSGAAVIGDLTESALKRAAGAKDSGVIMPGHGGMLDRVDSLLFAALVVSLGRALGSGAIPSVLSGWM